MPEFLRISQTVDGATAMPIPASSPWIRRYPHDSFSRASCSTADRTLRCVAGRPERPRRDRRRLAAAHEVPVPAHDRARSDDQSHRRQPLGRDRPREQCQPCPVRPCQTRMSARLLALRQSELMAQHEDLGVLPPLLPPRQPLQRHATGDNQEDQPQPHKPKIVPRPGRPHGPSSQRPTDIRPGGTGCRHPQAGPAAFRLATRVDL
jgi:hypothetical protein